MCVGISYRHGLVILIMYCSGTLDMDGVFWPVTTGSEAEYIDGLDYG